MADGGGGPLAKDSLDHGREGVESLTRGQMTLVMGELGLSENRLSARGGRYSAWQVHGGRGEVGHSIAAPRRGGPRCPAPHRTPTPLLRAPGPAGAGLPHG